RLHLARGALAGERVWLVGGAVRDELLGRQAIVDVDLIVVGDAAPAAKRIARAARGTAFELSDDFGAWRVVGPGHAWQVDISAMRGGSLDADLQLRDFTINAIACPLAGGDVAHPLRGPADPHARPPRVGARRPFARAPLRPRRL